MYAIAKNQATYLGKVWQNIENKKEYIIHITFLKNKESWEQNSNSLYKY